MNAALPRPGPARTEAGVLGRAALLALAAHALLIAGLTFGVNWRLRPPDVTVAAELWAALPKVAAPAPVETPAAPPPPPVAKPEPAPATLDAARQAEAQIAIERARRQRQLEQEREAERQRLAQAREQQRREEQRREQKAREEKAREAKAREERLKEERRRAQAAAAEREARAEEERLARQREANLARIRGQAGATGAPTATGTASQDAAPSAAYAGRIKARIKPNIVLTTEVSGNPVTEVEVRCAPDGTIVGRRIVKGSGNAVWDDTVLRAIDRTEILPRDTDGRVPSLMLLVFPRRE